MKRPAETGGVAMAAAVVIAYILGVTEERVILAMAVLVGCVPAVVTWFVVHRPHWWRRG